MSNILPFDVIKLIMFNFCDNYYIIRSINKYFYNNVIKFITKFKLRINPNISTGDRMRDMNIQLYNYIKLINTMKNLICIDYASISMHIHKITPINMPIVIKLFKLLTNPNIFINIVELSVSDTPLCFCLKNNKNIFKKLTKLKITKFNKKIYFKMFPNLEYLDITITNPNILYLGYLSSTCNTSLYNLKYLIINNILNISNGICISNLKLLKYLKLSNMHINKFSITNHIYLKTIKLHNATLIDNEDYIQHEKQSHGESDGWTII